MSRAGSSRFDLASRGGAIIISIVLIGCAQDSASNEVGNPFFPTHEDTGMSAAAILQGTLIKTSNCLIVDSATQGQAYLPIWSESFSWDEGKSSILDQEGNVLARVGQDVDLTGGQVSLDAASQLTGESIPDACQVGGYWNTTAIEPTQP